MLPKRYTILLSGVSLDNYCSTVPKECPSNGSKEGCPTCCCESSENVEFYDPDAPEPECTAPPAVYEMTFNFTWNEVCHPGDYESYLIFIPAWSEPIAVSHNTKYRLWDACMDDVSVGVSHFSQVGLTSVILQEFMAAGDNIHEYVIADFFLQSTSQLSQNITVDKDYQWVSALSQRGPPNDKVVGVADLRLCDGDEWKESVKVCFELFSTATASERVASEMERNSVQGNNCSFGFVEFDLMKTQVFISCT